MLRKATALFLLLIFLTGSTGFSLTYHFCTHAGSQYIGSFGVPAHDCEEGMASINAGKDCCHKEDVQKQEHEETSCCITPHTETQIDHAEKDHAQTHNCCNDQHALLKIKNVVKTASVTAPVIVFPIELPVFQAQYISSPAESISLSYAGEHPPDEHPSDLTILNSAFRI